MSMEDPLMIDPNETLADFIISKIQMEDPDIIEETKSKDSLGEWIISQLKEAQYLIDQELLGSTTAEDILVSFFFNFHENIEVEKVLEHIENKQSEEKLEVFLLNKENEEKED